MVASSVLSVGGGRSGGSAAAAAGADRGGVATRPGMHRRVGLLGSGPQRRRYGGATVALRRPQCERPAQARVRTIAGGAPGHGRWVGPGGRSVVPGIQAGVKHVGHCSSCSNSSGNNRSSSSSNRHSWRKLQPHYSRRRRPCRRQRPPHRHPLRPQPMGLDLRQMVTDSAHRCTLWLCFVRGGRERSCGIWARGTGVAVLHSCDAGDCGLCGLKNIAFPATSNSPQSTGKSFYFSSLCTSTSLPASRQQSERDPVLSFSFLNLSSTHLASLPRFIAFAPCSSCASLNFFLKILVFLAMWSPVRFQVQ